MIGGTFCQEAINEMAVVGHSISIQLNSGTDPSCSVAVARETSLIIILENNLPTQDLPCYHDLMI